MILLESLGVVFTIFVNIMLLALLFDFFKPSDKKFIAGIPLLLSFKICILQKKIKKLIDKYKIIKRDGEKEIEVVSKINALKELTEKRKRVLRQELDKIILSAHKETGKFVNSLPVYVIVEDMKTIKSIKDIKKFIETEVNHKIQFIDFNTFIKLKSLIESIYQTIYLEIDDKKFVQKIKIYNLTDKSYYNYENMIEDLNQSKKD